MLRFCLADNDELLAQSFALRHQVFVEEQGVAASEEIDDFEQSSRHLLALEDDQLVATVRWRRTPDGIKLERFAVRAGWRDRGVGSRLLTAVLDDIRDTAGPGQQLYLNAQLRAEPFYARAGFQRQGEIFSECGIHHVRMCLTR